MSQRGDNHARTANHLWSHTTCARRTALQVGAISILGLGGNHLTGLRQASAAPAANAATGFGRAKSCIFIFLSGGLSQHESFDPKPNAPENVRGEFKPISTQTSGLQICEYLPMLAQRSQSWALCRSLTHGSNDHSAGHHIMLTGRSDLPRGFQAAAPSRTDYPSIPAMVSRVGPQRNNLPPAAIIPERLIHSTGRIIPGQDGGEMGSQFDPWTIEAASFHNMSYGAFPEYSFDHQQRGKPDPRKFQAPQLTLPHGLGMTSFADRLRLLESLRSQRESLHLAAESQKFDQLRERAVSMLTDSKIHQALDVTVANEKTLDNYGRNAFGWSLLMARRLVDSGVQLIQVNLGNNETWDTHGNAFPHLKDRLLPPLDRSLSALLDDLQASGQLDETLVVVASEFGRTPMISHLREHYKLPGRDHWGAVQSVLFAGGGVRGGNVIGASDAQGGNPIDQPVKPENFAATIYHALGIAPSTTWIDAQSRPHAVYHGQPIDGLM